MKTTVLLLLALVALILVAALPGWRQVPERTAHAPQHKAAVLVGAIEWGVPCELEIAVGPETVFDRGRLTKAQSAKVAAGSFRFCEESWGKVLYVYDEAQDLLGRVVNPTCVRMLEDPPTP